MPLHSAPAPAPDPVPRRLLAVASAGGHWQQLMLMRPAFEGHDVTYMTTLAGLAERFGAAPVRVVPDFNRDSGLRTIWGALVVAARTLRLRPQVVISTGALPGVVALAMGRMMGARTIWVDSIANAETLSASGRLAKRFADLHLTQWPAVAAADGSDYAGSVL